MRVLPILLLLAACSPETGSGPVNLRYSAGDRDRLCLAGGSGTQRGGLILYRGESDVNCSLAGPAERTATGWLLRPDGDEDCSVALLEQPDGSLRTGSVGQACAYYCGPGASFTDRQLLPADPGLEVTDFGGEPLCPSD